MPNYNKYKQQTHNTRIYYIIFYSFIFIIPPIYTYMLKKKQKQKLVIILIIKEIYTLNVYVVVIN